MEIWRNIIKNIITICIVLVIGYIGYQKLAVTKPNSDSDISQYSLATVNEKPIPKEAIFKLWEEAALKFCSNYTEEDINLTKHTSSQCRDRVTEKHDDCERALMADAPSVIDQKIVSKQLGKKYFACVLPKPLCNGVEINSTEEAQEKCK